AQVNGTLLNGETPLMMAARTGDTQTIQLLLDRGADINATENLRGTTALMWAAAYKNPDAVRLLLANGADLTRNSSATEPGRNPYLAPTARSRIRSFYQNSGQGGRALDAAELEDDAPEITVTREELVKRLPQELVEDFQRESRQANEQGEIEAPQRKQWGGLTALHFAVREGNLESVKVLVEGGADVNQVSEFGWTPLLTATQNRYYQMGKYLLENGANPNIANEGGWNPLYIATDNRNIEGGDYPTRKPDMDHLEYIKLLLDAGADPNLRMASSTETRTIFTHQWLREEGATPFLRAAQSSDLELMNLLLEHGADPNINTRDGVTPLMVASGIAWVEGVTYEWSEDANRETIAMLIELGNDVNAQDMEDGRTALMGAAHKGRNYAVEMLVEAGADLAARDIGSRDSLNSLAG
ncbi:MAG: ankyrin repeat domain-containing protein, partial [Pseudohongiellaceae bacterium]